jgi:hypothetical protein
MKRKTAVVVLVAAFFTLSIGISSLVTPASAGGGYNVTRLDMMTTLDTPPAFENAEGRIKFNRTGTTFKYILKASGLGPVEDYIVLFCGLVVGGGTSDKNGALHTWGSANATWYLESDPSEPVKLLRVSGLGSWPGVEDFELILQSPPTGYDWTQ